MPPSAASTRRIWPAFWSSMIRDRLEYFRLLCFLLAVVTLWGVGVTFGIVAPGTAVHRMAAAIAVAGLTGFWEMGRRRRGIAVRWLPLEAALLLTLAFAVRREFGPFGVMYVALQFRALYGTRREATIVAFAYALILIAGYAVVPAGFAVLQPIIVVQLAIGAFGAYLMHTLAEVLGRDQERQRALRESEQRFRSVIDNLREALLITDVDDRIILANPRVLDVLGYSARELLGRSASELLLPESQRDDFRDRMVRRLAGQSELYETQLVRKDGQRIHAEISAAPYRNSSGVIIGTLGAISDISERKRLELRLRQGMRMEAVGQLAGGVAHDFNNLLTVIKCHTELVLSDLPAADPNRESVVEIERSADRGAQLTQRLLAFSRKQLLQPRRVRLADVVADCAPTLRQLVAANVVFTTRHEDAAEPVFADPLQIEHVLSTLVRNAGEAMPAGGHLVVETRVLDVDELHVPAPGQDMPAGRYICVAVSDTGGGLPGAVMARIFEPFVTTKEPGEGSGLGLASVFGSVRQSGGYVSVESAPGSGTTFRLYFPALPADGQLRQAPSLELLSA
jgi:PAS domain S-box-containing protein